MCRRNLAGHFPGHSSAREPWPTIFQALDQAPQSVRTTSEALDRALQSVRTISEALDRALQNVRTTSEALDQAPQSVRTTPEALDQALHTTSEALIMHRNVCRPFSGHNASRARPDRAPQRAPA